MDIGAKTFTKKNQWFAVTKLYHLYTWVEKEIKKLFIIS